MSRWGLPTLYVGQSFHPPEVRFEQHTTGVRASSKARRYGVRLRPEIHEVLDPYQRQRDAEIAERRLARRLARAGFITHCDGKTRKPPYKAEYLRLWDASDLERVSGRFDEIAMALAQAPAINSPEQLAAALTAPTVGGDGDAGRFAHVDQAAVLSRTRRLL